MKRTKTKSNLMAAIIKALAGEVEIAKRGLREANRRGDVGSGAYAEARLAGLHCALRIAREEIQFA